MSNRIVLRLGSDIFELKTQNGTGLHFWRSAIGHVTGGYFVDKASAINFAKDRVRLLGSENAVLLGAENEDQKENN